MKKNIKRISTVGMSREAWLAHRNEGIGGSDIGAIFGIDRFKPAIKLFHQKSGLLDLLAKTLRLDLLCSTTQ